MMKRMFRKLLGKQIQNPKETPPAPVTKEPKEYGLKLVYEGENPYIDTIAIHGHGGHWRKSWIFTQEDGTETFWLRDFLPKILPQARIFSFGYDASDALTSSVEDIASALLNDIIQTRREAETSTRPIIFIAHSFGGMLLKGILGVCEGILPLQSFTDLRSSTHSLLLLGVPLDAQASFGNLGMATMGASDPSSDTPLIAALKRDILWFQDQVGRYDEIKDEFVVTHFVESDGMPARSRGVEGTLLKGDATQIQVLPVSAENGRTIRMNKTHGMMVRFASADDEDFKKVAACLLEMVHRTTNGNEWRLLKYKG